MTFWQVRGRRSRAASYVVTIEMSETSNGEGCCETIASSVTKRGSEDFSQELGNEQRLPRPVPPASQRAGATILLEASLGCHRRNRLRSRS